MRIVIPEPDPREPALPKWSRELIADYRRAAQDAIMNAHAARLATSPETSPIILDPFADVPIGLGEQPYLHAKTANGYVGLRVDGPVLRLIGEFGLILNPHSGNHVSVEVRK